MNDIDKYIQETKAEAEKLRSTLTRVRWQDRLRYRLSSLKVIGTFLFTFYSALDKYFLGPIQSVFKLVFVDIIWYYYRAMWLKFAFVETDGKGKFSKKRGTVLLAATLMSLYVGFYAIGFIKDLTLYLATGSRDEVVYLSNAQEVDPENNIHSVQGCIVDVQEDGGFSCDTENSLYFRIEPSLFAHAWYLVNEGDVFYPDYVAATIAPGWQECVITSYGFRLKLFVRRLQIYPELLSVSCSRI